MISVLLCLAAVLLAAGVIIYVQKTGMQSLRDESAKQAERLRAESEKQEEKLEASLEGLQAQLREEIDEQGRELSQQIKQGFERLLQDSHASQDAGQQSLDAMRQALDKRIEHWTWERFQRTDKQIERWTWERYKRRKKDDASLLWNILYELEPDRMISLVSQSPTYDVAFYWANRYGSVTSAQRVLRHVFSWVPHESIVDFGCGTGTWLWVAKALGGGKKSLGLDGEYVPGSLLMIPEDDFQATDLEKAVTLPCRYDLAMSLEVAEHLAPEAADIFVESLCGAADVILFSAAHPGQGGDGHVNEQPWEYWAEKFEAHGYKTIDIRPYIQDDMSIEHWYRKNLALFVHPGMYEAITVRMGADGKQ